MTHVAINEPDPNEILFEETPVTFCEDLLIYPGEVAKFEPRDRSAAGLDGLSVYDTRKINCRVKAKLFSLFLMLHWVPAILINSLTMFIPKKENTESPAHLRPISIASNLSRQFHKLLVSRINSTITFDKWQYGF